MNLLNAPPISRKDNGLGVLIYVINMCNFNYFFEISNAPPRNRRDNGMGVLLIYPTYYLIGK